MQKAPDMIVESTVIYGGSMQLPLIVRQMGKVTGENRVYVEDYVYTYLNELKKKEQGFPIRAALYGHAFSRQGVHFYLIYGASGIVGEMERGRNQEDIHKTFFHEYGLIGYVNLYPGQKLPGTDEGCYIFYETNEAMQNYMISCYKNKGRIKETGENPAFTYIKELLRKAFLGMMTVLSAAAITIINNYSCMYGFTMMAARALQEAG